MKCLIRATALAAFLAALPAAALNHEAIVLPIAPGTYNVACSNIEQDASRMIPGAVPADYWEGHVVNDQPLYVTQLLTAPQTAIVYDAVAPDDRGIYPNTANARVPFVGFVCHPTPASNDDPHYALPGGAGVVPHMQAAGAAPKLTGGRFPLIVYSHGLGGSPIGSGYIESVVALAAQGYVVAAPFHADTRFSRVRIEDLSDFLYLLTQYDRVAEMMLMRPVALKALVDVLLAHPQFSQAIDPDRIAGFGASLGGQAILNLMGAKLTTSIDKACHETVRDPRIKLAVGYVPYSGQSFLPAFCDGQSGAAEVDRPFLAIAGTADTTAPIKLTQQAVNRLRGSRFMVELIDGQHELRPEDAGDLFTWMVTFYRAYLQGDANAMASFIRMRGVIGGRDDDIEIDAHVPRQFAPGEVLLTEMQNGDRYTLAATAGNIGVLQGSGYSVTGHSFKAWSTVPPVGLTACHYTTAILDSSGSAYGPCSGSKRLGWTYDPTLGFYITKADAFGGCPPGLLQVNRLYLPRYAISRSASSVRLVTSDSAARESAANGWILLPTTMCARP